MWSSSFGPRRRTPRPAPPPGGHTQSQEPAQFGSFQASLLYCPTCQTATPTRERLLLVLSTGNLYEYFCAECGTSTGEKTDQAKQDIQIIHP